MTGPRVLIIATGRHHDAGADPALRVLDALGNEPLAQSWWLTLMQDAQLRMEHAMDLQGNDLVIFMDSGAPGSADDSRNGRARSADAAFAFMELTPAADYSITPAERILTPADLLHAVSTLGRQRDFPQSFRLRLGGRGADSMDGADVGAAVAFIVELLERPDGDAWRARAGT